MNRPINPQQRSLVAGLILVGLLIVSFFGWRTVRAFRQVREHRPPPFNHEPAETDVELIRDWMTIHFISKTYRVPPEVLFDALEIPPHGNQEKSLEQLNEEYYPEAEGVVLEKIKATVRASIPVPSALTPIPPATPLSPATPILP